MFKSCRTLAASSPQLPKLLPPTFGKPSNSKRTTRNLRKQFMSQKLIYLVLSGLLMLVLLLTGLQTAPRSTYAAEPSATPESDFPVSVETTGIIQSLSKDQIVLADGSAFKIDTKTKLPKTALQPGITVTVEAELDSEE